jgi:nucleotide-binding universal stress UspA family protein
VELSPAEIDLHRILVAHDFSPDSELALKYGCALAEEFEAELHLLHVLNTAGREEPELAWAQPSADCAYTLLASKLQRALPKEAFLWCNVINAVRYGKAHGEVLAYAKEHQIELICIGASGRNWKRLIFGSTVDRVLREAPCPVLVARPIRHRELAGSQLQLETTTAQ